jgi:hypothetical protein
LGGIYDSAQRHSSSKCVGSDSDGEIFLKIVDFDEFEQANVRRS